MYSSARPVRARAHLVARTDEAADVWPSYQVAAVGPGHHMERSTTMGKPFTVSTVAAKDVSESAGSSPSTQIVSRLEAGTSRCLTTVAPSGR